MSLINEETMDKWFEKDHIIYKNFEYIFKNPLWDKKVPSGFSLCPYFWLSWIVGFLILRILTVPILVTLSIPLKVLMKVFSGTSTKLRAWDERMEMKHKVHITGQDASELQTHGNFMMLKQIAVCVVLCVVFTFLNWVFWTEFPWITTKTTAILAVIGMSLWQIGICLLPFAILGSYDNKWKGICTTLVIVPLVPLLTIALWLVLGFLFSLLLEGITTSFYGIAIWQMVLMFVMFCLISYYIDSKLGVTHALSPKLSRFRTRMYMYKLITNSYKFHSFYIDDEMSELSRWPHYRERIYNHMFDKYVHLPSKLFDFELSSVKKQFAYGPYSVLHFFQEVHGIDDTKFTSTEIMDLADFIESFHNELIEALRTPDHKYHKEMVELHTKLVEKDNLYYKKMCEVKADRWKWVGTCNEWIFNILKPVIFIIKFVWKCTVSVILAIYVLLKSKKEGVCPYKQFKYVEKGDEKSQEKVEEESEEDKE